MRCGSGAKNFKRRWANNVRVGIFSDIHGSLAALRAVWAALEADGLASGLVLNAGDTVGYGPDPEGCVRFLKERPNVVSVKGNYDKNAALFPEREAEYRKKWGKARPDKFAAIQRDSEVISSDTRRWLSALPAEETRTLEGVPLLLTHYSPGSKTGIGSWTSDDEIVEMAALTDALVVVCGHTHTDFARDVGGVLWVNPGSLGRSWDHRLHYAVLTIEAGQPPKAALKIAPRSPILGASE